MGKRLRGCGNPKCEEREGDSREAECESARGLARVHDFAKEARGNGDEKDVSPAVDERFIQNEEKVQSSEIGEDENDEWKTKGEFEKEMMENEDQSKDGCENNKVKRGWARGFGRRKMEHISKETGLGESK
jgi:hypothetical protein